MRGGGTEGYIHVIYNDWWMVRHYALQRTPTERLRRRQAIRKLGLTVRAAFNSSDDFEPLLIALVEGANPKEYRPF